MDRWNLIYERPAPIAMGEVVRDRDRHWAMAMEDLKGAPATRVSIEGTGEVLWSRDADQP